jgi:hypothetical protein
MITINTKGNVGPLFCDYLSMVYSPANEWEKKEIKKGLKTLVDGGAGKKVYRGFYRNSVKVLFGGFPNASVLLQTDSKYPNRPFFRIEFNPSYATPYGVRSLINRVIPWGYERFMDQGFCSRIDLTVDVDGVDIEDVLAWRKATHLETIVRSRQGRLESITLGSKKSDTQYIIYDKLAESKHANSAVVAGNMPVTRIEFRRKRSISLEDLPNIKNPFSKLQVASYRRFGETKQEYRLFLDSCRLKGTTNAIKSLDLDKRGHYERWLQSYKSPWWEPDVLWEQLPRVIDELKNPQLVQNRQAA